MFIPDRQKYFESDCSPSVACQPNLVMPFHTKKCTFISETKYVLILGTFLMLLTEGYCNIFPALAMTATTDDGRSWLLTTNERIIRSR